MTTAIPMTSGSPTHSSPPSPSPAREVLGMLVRASGAVRASRRSGPAALRGAMATLACGRLPSQACRVPKCPGQPSAGRGVPQAAAGLRRTDVRQN